jgi:hypothetical protein
MSILAGLAHNLTVVARSFYSDSPQGQVVPSDVMIALNELQHQISGQQWHLADEDQKRYPDDVFVNGLFERAANPKLEKDFLRYFERVISRLGKE